MKTLRTIFFILIIVSLVIPYTGAKLVAVEKQRADASAQQQRTKNEKQTVAQEEVDNLLRRRVVDDRDRNLLFSASSDDLFFEALLKGIICTILAIFGAC